MILVYVLMGLTILLSIITVCLQTSGYLGVKFLIKALASFSFMIMGLCSLFIVENIEVWQISIMAGLLFGLMGDVFLCTNGIVKKEYIDPLLLAGLLFFLIGHIVYIIVFLTLAGSFNYWLICALILVPLIVFMLIKTKIIQPRPDKAVIPIMGYAIVISLMLASAINYITATSFSTRSILIFTGAILFTLSDLLLGIYNFSNLDDKLRLKHTIAFIYMPAYYIAQTLFALSIIY